MVKKNRNLLRLVDKKLQKLAGTADALLENHLEHESSSENKAQEESRNSDPLGEDPIPQIDRAPGSLGSPISANLIDVKDMKGNASIFSGEKPIEDPYGDRVKKAVKAKLQEFEDNNSNVRDRIRDKSNEDTRYS